MQKIRKQNHWLNVEIKILREEFERDPNVSYDRLCELLPRHSRGSIRSERNKMKLPRLTESNRQIPTWTLIANLLIEKPRSCQEIADALGRAQQTIQRTMAGVRGHWHICGHQRNPASWTPVYALGAGENVPMPRRSRKKREQRPNPFAVAAGLVNPVKASKVERRLIERWAA